MYSILPYLVTPHFLFPHTFHILPWPTHPTTSLPHHVIISLSHVMWSCVSSSHVMLWSYYILIIHITSYYLCMYTPHYPVYSTIPSPCLFKTFPNPRGRTRTRMPASAWKKKTHISYTHLLSLSPLLDRVFLLLCSKTNLYSMSCVMTILSI